MNMKNLIHKWNNISLIKRIICGLIIGIALGLIFPQATAISILGDLFVGILGGIFVGCWAMALAEMLNVFPIFIRRMKIIKSVPYLILGIAGRSADCADRRSFPEWTHQ